MKLVTADLSNIEGRVLAWVAGEEWKLQAFRDYDAGTGPDVYNLTATSVIGGDPWKVSKPYRNAFGKVVDLACGYAGGVGAFQTFSKNYGVNLLDYADVISENVDLTHQEQARANWNKWGEAKADEMGVERDQWLVCETLKLAWRARHPATQRFWWDLDAATKNAVKNPWVRYPVGNHIACGVVNRAGFPYLLIKLPSGKYLCYFDPRIEKPQDVRLLDTGAWGVFEEGRKVSEWPTQELAEAAARKREGVTYMGLGSDPDIPGARQWLRRRGGSHVFTENVVQSLARDVLAHNMPAIEDAGYAIVLTVHDELVTESDGTAEELSALMSQVPPWAPGLPLAAAGFEATRYRKD